MAQGFEISPAVRLCLREMCFTCLSGYVLSQGLHVLYVLT